MVCLKCGNQCEEGQSFCARCGAPLNQKIEDVFCVNCGSLIKAGQMFCPNCGTTVTGALKKRRFQPQEQQKKSSVFRSQLIENAIKDLKGGYITEEQAEKISGIVNAHSLGAAASGIAAAIPGVGSAAAIAGGAGFIWSMYYRIGKVVGINLSKQTLKFIGSGIVSNLAANAGATLAASAISLIPGVGTVAATLMMAGVNYALTNVSGVIYINLMASSIKSGVNLENMSKEELKDAMEEVIKEHDVKKMMKESRDEYIKARKSGVISGNEKVELENEDE